MTDAVSTHPRRDWFTRVGRTLVRWGAVLSTLIAALWAAGTWWTQYQTQVAQTQASAKRESQRPFLEKQLQFYFEAAKVTSKLATLSQELQDKGPDWEQSWSWAYRRFWELYWGELAIVESREVAGAMVRFGEPLRALHACVSTANAKCVAEQKALEQLSLALAAEIRKSIETSWDYPLPPLLGKP